MSYLILTMITILFISMLVYTMINTTAFITAISTMLMMFLICSTILFLTGSSFASFILYISAIAGISVLLSYCLTMIPKISYSESTHKMQTFNTSKTPVKQKIMIFSLIFIMTTINLIGVSFPSLLVPSKKESTAFSSDMMFSSKTTLLKINQNILSSPFWSWTSLFLTIVLFILMISSLKMISSLSSPMGPSMIKKK
nr:NADH dehydrogenase subunit 6 [Mytilopsis leucophaeata]